MDNSTSERYATQYETDEQLKESNRAKQREASGEMVENFIQRTAQSSDDQKSDS